MQQLYPQKHAKYTHIWNGSGTLTGISHLHNLPMLFASNER